MSITAQLEAAVLAQLDANPDINTLKIAPYPTEPGKYKLLHAKGAVLVFIGNSEYVGKGAGSANRAVNVLVTLLLRNLTDHIAGYYYQDAIRAALFGYDPGNQWDDLRLVSDTFVAEGEGVWQWDFVFKTSRTLVSDYATC